MRKLRLASTAALLLLGPSVAWAQDAEARNDARCLVVTTAMMAKEQTRAAGMIGMMYFLGRLDGRGLGDRVDELLVREVQGMKGPQLVAEAKRCGELLKARGQELEAMGKRVKAMEPKLES